MILILSLALTGCAQGEEVDDDSGSDGFEIGFTPSTDELSSERIALKSANRIFDINNVTLDLYYGFFMSPDIEHERECSSYYDYGRLYLFNDTGCIKFVYQTDEQLTSEEYRITLTSKNEWGFSFNHCEKLTIPSDLFTNDEGYISVIIRTRDLKNQNVESGTFISILGTAIHYKMIDENTVEFEQSKNYWTEEEVDYLSSIWPTEWPEE